MEVLRGGVRPAWLVQCNELLNFDQLGDLAGSDAVDIYVRATALQDLLQRAIARLGDGSYGHAASLLFGVAAGSKGRLLKDRRRFAAEELDVLPSTFRRNYENRIIEDLAVELWQLLKIPR
jgi:hypothetical protein